MTTKTSKLKITSVHQYESIVDLYCLLDILELKEAWKVRSAILRREGEYWDRCDHCDEPLGEHEELCYDEDGPRGREYDDGASFED